jgi:hypothetical protein
MSHEGNPSSNEQLEAYLDGQLSPSERAAMESRLSDAAELKAAIRLQSQIDDALRRQFHAPQPSASFLRELRSTDPTTSKTAAFKVSSVSRRTWIGISLAVCAAASGALIGLVFLADRGDRRRPYFQPQPLVDIYHATIKDGFAPYYECNDPQRFASTFQRRQGIPLRLIELPAGCELGGLANSGGLSTRTTSMLCYDHQEPVLVFVDRLEADQPRMAERKDPGLFVHRKEYRGLVMYEISPFADPRFIDYLVAIDDRDSF